MEEANAFSASYAHILFTANCNYLFLAKYPFVMLISGACEVHNLSDVFAAVWWMG